MRNKKLEEIEYYKILPPNSNILLNMKDGETVKLITHFDDKLFSGIYESRNNDNNEYHFNYKQIDSIQCF